MPQAVKQGLMASLSIVVPVYNEQSSIRENLTKLWRFSRRKLGPCQIVAVNDGSTDATLRILRRLALELGLTVVSYRKNKGIGAAVRAGWKAARGNVVVVIDSDLSYPLKDIPLLVDKVVSGGFDIASASPFIAGARMQGVPFHRELISRAGALPYWPVIGKRMTTYACCFRAYRRECLPKLAFLSNGFESQSEIIYRAARAGLKIIEVPSVLTASPNRKSHFKVAKVVPKHVKLLFGVMLADDARSRLGLKR
jgi:dolichol-phosphate mannosyltransferase